MQFNEKLKKLRAEKGISQAELAKQIFVSRSAVAKWENGLGLPSEESLKLLAEFFGVSADDLRSDPIQEDIVIQKNGTLSKQKIFITLLSVLLTAIIIVSGVLLGLYIGHDAVQPANVPSEITVPGRGLLLSSEKEVCSGELSTYSDDELSPDKYFSPSRIFVISNDTGAVELPELVFEAFEREDGSRTYEDVNYRTLSFFTTEGIYISVERNSAGDERVFIHINDYFQVEYKGCVNIKWGKDVLSIKVIKEPIPVDSVKIKLYNNESNKVGLGETQNILIDVLPYNASYQDYTYTVEKIEKPDGSLYSGDLSQYASITNNTLKHSVSIELGSKIYLFATATHGNIRSNTLVIEVTRIPISRT